MERIITYDLKHKDSDDYQKLYNVFTSLNAKQLTESTYVINTSLSQKDIINKIKSTIYPDDIVYYISVDSETHKIFYIKIS